MLPGLLNQKSLSKGYFMLHKAVLIAKAPLIYTESNPLATAGGRKLWRHPSNMGTVMEFNDGQDRKVLILDAKYRAKGLMMTSDDETDTSLPNYSQYNTNDTRYIDGGSSDITPSACASLTDATLNSLWANSIDANTSKYNTDVWLTKPDCDCATHCRSIKVNGVGCDIPNIQISIRIYCEGVLLDELDPTVSLYPKFKLNHWFNKGALWSSSELSTSEVLAVVWNGIHGNGPKYFPYDVCPVLEI